MPKGIYKHKSTSGFQKGHPQFNTGRTHFKKGRKHVPIDTTYLKGENNWRWKGGDITKVCPQCGESFSFRRNGKWNNARRTFCSQTCANITNCPKGTGSWSYKDGHGYEPYSKEFVRVREKIRARDNWHCVDCGIPQEEFEKALDVHHVDGDKSNNDPTNLVTLCKKCHGIRKKEMRRIYGRKRNN